MKNLLNRLQNKIVTLDSYEFIKTIAENSWKLLGKETTDFERRFVTASSWLSYVAIGTKKHSKNHRVHSLQQKELKNLVK